MQRFGTLLVMGLLGSVMLSAIDLASSGGADIGDAVAKLPAPKFLYTIGDTDIGGFSVKTKSGQPTVLATSPFGGFSTTNTPCPDLAAANPAGTLLIVPDACNDDIVVSTINTDGSLTPVAGSPFASGTGNFALEQPLIDPSGKFLYVPEDSPGQVLGFNIASNGTLTAIAGSPFLAAGQDERLAITPDGKFLLVADANNTDLAGPTLTIFSVDPSTGVLTTSASSPFFLDSVPSSISITPSGSFVYVASAEANDIDGFSIDSSANLTRLTGLPIISGINTHSISITPDGKFLFAANNGELDAGLNGNVSAFSINATTGALTAVAKSPFTAGSNPKEVATDPSGKFLFVTNEDGDNMSGFKIGRTGKLTKIKKSPFATNVGSEGIAITH
jgi:6-phosphogluconolactonase (cycloisomerase 2 family)